MVKRMFIAGCAFACLLTNVTHVFGKSLFPKMRTYKLSSPRIARPRKQRTYTKKAPYAGFGKVSKVNGRIKTKGISGHSKKTYKGYAFVNPYARSRQ